MKEPLDKPQPETPWLTVSQAAQRTQVSNKMIYLAVAKKRLRAVRIGTTIRIHESWIDAWLEAAATELNPEAPGASVPFRPRKQM